MPQRTVMVVEDDPQLRLDTASMLEEAGLTVAELDSADDALAYLGEQSARVAAVFTDVELVGNTDGFELARAITQTWPEITVLVTSGRRRIPSDFPSSARFVPKPWLPLEVLTALSDAVERH